MIVLLQVIQVVPQHFYLLILALNELLVSLEAILELEAVMTRRVDGLRGLET